MAAAATVATPLRPRGGRAALANLVVGGLGGATLAASVRRWSPRRAVVTGGAVGALTLAVERVGTATGIPFGRYRYTGTLRPAVAGVPAAVPVAWFAVGLPAREVAAAVLGPAASSVARVGLGAVALTAWDAFLDPQMVGEGYWRWDRPGRYRGIPATNYAGWLATGAGLMALLEVALPPQQPEPALVAIYTFVAVMATLGHAVFFDDRLVASVGGLSMLPLALAAVARVPRG